VRLLLPLIFSTTSVLASEDSRELAFDRFLGEERAWAFHLHSDYESRYASEGRDSLDGDSLASGTFEAAWDAVSLGAWYGISPEQSYDELQLSTALSWDWKDLEWYVAYTHLRFPQDGATIMKSALASPCPGFPVSSRWICRPITPLMPGARSSRPH
jgi:hypothetical protein